MQRLTLLSLILIFWLNPLMAGEAPLWSPREASEIQVLKLMTYGEKVFHWQRSVTALYEKMREHSRQNKGAIDPRHLEELRQKAQFFHDFVLNNSLLERKKSEVNFLGTEDHFNLTFKETKVEDYVRFRSLLEERRMRRNRGLRFDKRKAKKYFINPNDPEGKKLWHKLIYQLSSQLIFLDAYAIGLAPFMETKAFRAILIRDLAGDVTSQKLEDVWFSYMETVFQRDSLLRTLSLYLEGQKRIEEESPLEKFLIEYSKESPTFKELKKRKSSFTFFRDMMKNMNFMAKRRWDTYRDITIEVLFNGSKFFGNTVGVFQSRHGFLYHWTKEQEEVLANRFKPLDVLMEKTPFRLTDKFIPGHFGHAAIWTGGKQELQDLGVWEELPALTKRAREQFDYRGPSFQERVLEGARIIEALRPGVEFNTLRHFMEIDDLAALRMRDCEEGERPVKQEEAVCLNDKLKKEYLIKAFSQIGKDYDFAFNVNTEETIVCSELIYRTYLDVDFDTSLTVGQYNISPDQVAKRAVGPNDPFFPILLFHEGEEVEETQNGLRIYMRELMDL